MGLEAPAIKNATGGVEGITYAHRIVEAIARFSDRPAIRFKEGGQWRELSYEKLGEWVRDFAAALRQYGIRRGDRVAVWLETCWQWVVADWALQILGAITVPIYHSLPAGQAAGIIRDSGAKAVFSLNSRLEALGTLGLLQDPLFCINLDGASVGIPLSRFIEIGHQARTDVVGKDGVNFWPEVRPDELSAIIYTSGTTGEPKGVMLSHRNVLANVDMSIQYFMPPENQVVFLHLPMAHVVARNTSVPCTLLTGNVLAIAEPAREKFLSNLMEVAPTSFLTVPFLLDKFMARILEEIAAKPKPLQALIRRAIELGKQRALAGVQGGAVTIPRGSLEFQILDRFILRKIRGVLGGRLQFMVIGGANSNRESVEFFWGIGIPVYEGYGATEVTNSATFTCPTDMRIGTVGRHAPGVEVRLAADGEVLIRGPNVMEGYWNRPQATAEVIDAEGWYHSGDIGEMDEQGYLRIVDRKKEIFVLATGKKVAPQAVENRIKLSPCVANVCVIGDRRKYLTALVAPDWETVRQRLGLSGKGEAADLRIGDLLSEEVRKYMEGLAEFERIKRFLLIPETFTVENRMLSPILKLRRREIAEHYRREIEQLYAEEPPSEVLSL